MRAVPTVKRRWARTTSSAAGPGAGWSSPACSRSSSMCIRDVASSTRRTLRTTAPEIIGKVIDHSERQRFRFAVVDCDRDAEPSSLDPRGRNQWDSRYAAFYAPWIRVSDPQSGATELVPPAGTCSASTPAPTLSAASSRRRRTRWSMAARRASRSTSTAPAGRAQPARASTRSALLPRGAATGSGARGRSSSDPEWKYVNVRRLFIFLEHSIDKGTQWVVFEPNDERLWAQHPATRSRTSCSSSGADGALMGTNRREAFFVTLRPHDDDPERPRQRPADLPDRRGARSNPPSS